MNTETHRQHANDIGRICHLLRGPYKRNGYGKVKAITSAVTGQIGVRQAV